jgi:adenine-specific DNA-methyltransferase
MAKAPTTKKDVVSLTHDEASRKNIPTAEYQSVMRMDEQSPIRIAYGHRNRDLDPQLVWRGKDEQDWSDLVVSAPPLYIQEKVHPKVLIDDLKRRTDCSAGAAQVQIDLFADFNGLPSEAAHTEFYQHDAHWSNRMILGDSLQVMASLAEREALRGKVQCIYIDPPYGIRFNSNFQWSTTSRDVKDGNGDHITREPEQVKAFRDTWRDGIHSYLTYLRDRLTVARDLLAASGSIFLQIGDENVHRVRTLMDEVFGTENFCSEIVFQKTTGQTSELLAGAVDHLLWFARNKEHVKFHALYWRKSLGGTGTGEYQYLQEPNGIVRRLSAEEISTGRVDSATGRVFASDNLTSQKPPGAFPVTYQGKTFTPGAGYWKTGQRQFPRLLKSSRAIPTGSTLKYRRFLSDFEVMAIANYWPDTSSGASRLDPKVYVVQTTSRVLERCILMATDPGDLVLDPTCGSGTTAYVAEQWGRRWITIDTSRVALALARARIMGARYSYYLLADSPAGQLKQAEVQGKVPSASPTQNKIRHGFVYERVPHVTLKSIANNAEIDVIWEDYQARLEPLHLQLNAVFNRKWEEWEIPCEADIKWPAKAKELHAAWWEQRIARQKAIDASIEGKADFEYLYDEPYEDKKKVRVAGPFTVESLSPHRVLAVNEDDDLIGASTGSAGLGKFADEDDPANFVNLILENLRTSGVQQSAQTRQDSLFVFGSVAGNDDLC